MPRTTPKPAAGLQAELIWGGKYDASGVRAAPRLPQAPPTLEYIESIGGPPGASTARDDFRNLLVSGDNKLALAALRERFRGAVDLITIDPPFAVGVDYTVDVHLDGDAESGRERLTLAAVAYRDAWGRGADSYLHMLYERLALMRDLLAETGSIYVHCDWRLDYLLRSLMDDVFGRDSFRNAIVWKRDVAGKGAKKGSRQWPRNSDVILLYSKSPTAWTFHQPYKALSEHQRRAYRYRDADGRLYKAVQLGDYSAASIARLEAQGLIHVSSSGQKYKKYYLDEAVATVDGIWDDIPGFGTRTAADEQTGYATQKPEALLARMIEASSNPGDLVLDAFCGSGTALAVAEKLGRRWIGIDQGRRAIHTSRKRLVGLQRELAAAGHRFRAFDIYTLGESERRWWRSDRLADSDDAYRRTVLQFYGATPLADVPGQPVHCVLYGELHPFSGPLSPWERDGVRVLKPGERNKTLTRPLPEGEGPEGSTRPLPRGEGQNGRVLVYVAGIEGVLTGEALRGAAETARGAGAAELHCLAWEVEDGLAREAAGIADELGLPIRLRLIPREIMEPNCAAAFFEPGHLNADIIQREGRVDVALARFVPPLPDAAGKDTAALRERAAHAPFDFIDYWAVDFEHRPRGPFVSQWQSYRTRKDRRLAAASDIGWRYATPGPRTIAVQVVDVFGVATITTLDLDAPPARCYQPPVAEGSPQQGAEDC